MKTKLPHRQGDILLVPVTRIPEGAHKLPANSHILLAEGESAGARHEVVNGARRVTAYQLAEGLYLDVETATQVIHPEHEAIALEPGTYEVIRQQEFKREWRQVVD